MGQKFPAACGEAHGGTGIHAADHAGEDSGMELQPVETNLQWSRWSGRSCCSWEIHVGAVRSCAPLYRSMLEQSLKSCSLWQEPIWDQLRKDFILWEGSFAAVEE